MLPAVLEVLETGVDGLQSQRAFRAGKMYVVDGLILMVLIKTKISLGGKSEL